MRFCHKLWFSIPYIFATQCCRPWIFQTINSVRSNNLSLKYQRFRPPGCRDIGFRNFEFVAKLNFFRFRNQILRFLCFYEMYMKSYKPNPRLNNNKTNMNKILQKINSEKIAFKRGKIKIYRFLIYIKGIESLPQSHIF